MRNGEDRESAEYTCAEGLEYRAIMALWIEPENPNFDNAEERYPQCTLSNAFSASRDRRTEGVPEHPTWWMMSIIILVASDACRPLVKPDWSTCIREGRILTNLLAIIFA